MGGLFLGSLGMLVLALFLGWAGLSCAYGLGRGDRDVRDWAGQAAFLLVFLALVCAASCGAMGQAFLIIARTAP